jgi:hypothetical protein
LRRSPVRIEDRAFAGAGDRDRRREPAAGHDQTWVRHGLAPGQARGVFNMVA